MISSSKNSTKSILSLLGALAVLSLSACQKAKETTVRGPTETGLSTIEVQALNEQIQTHGAEASVSVLISASEAEWKSLQISKQEIQSLEQESGRVFGVVRTQASTVQNWNQQNQVFLALNGTVQVESEDSFQINEQALFGGKREFGIEAWEKKYPLADGRGAVIAVVDDGVALDRPGLSKTTTGEPKIIRSQNSQPVWWAPVRDGQDPFQAETAAFKYDQVLEQIKDAKRVGSFRLNGWGANPEMKRRAKDPGVDFTRLGFAKQFYGIVYEKENDAQKIFLVDTNGDSVISSHEVYLPIRYGKGAKTQFTRSGEPMAFDWIEPSEAVLPSNQDFDHPAEESNIPLLGYVSVTLPEVGIKGGNSTHGEGVASVAAGFQIGGRNFSGVAPGAQIVDLDLTPPGGIREYTIGEIARVLRMGGLQADVVNLSYSLFFQSAVSQVAMGRWMTERLKDTNALYLFSAGNNGPGRKSMNRALLYPSFSIPVGAYLTPEMAQTTFGSAKPIGGVVTYSSRGPGLDGASGALVVSPLAGMAETNRNGGVRPFSGTSSATPALAGFVARLVSQAKIDRLKIDRDLLREAILESAESIPGEAFVDQGFGLPKLLKAYELYRMKIQDPGLLESLQVSVSANGTFLQRFGIQSRGVLIEMESDRGVEREVRLSPVYRSHATPGKRDGYVVPIILKSRTGLIDHPEALLFSQAGLRFNLRIRPEAFETPGEFLDEIMIIDRDTGRRLAVVPVTVLNSLRFTNGRYQAIQNVKAQSLLRSFVERPASAQYLIITRETVDGLPSCGRAALYAPNGTRLSSVSSQNFESRQEWAFETRMPGTYEWVIESRGNHTDCSDQNFDTQMQWVGLDLNLLNYEKSSSGNFKLNLSAVSTVGRVHGQIRLSNWMNHRQIEFKREKLTSADYWTEVIQFENPGLSRIQFSEPVRRRLLDSGSYIYFNLMFEPDSFTGKAQLPRTLTPSSLVDHSVRYEFSTPRSSGRMLFTHFDRGEDFGTFSPLGNRFLVDFYTFLSLVATSQSRRSFTMIKDQSRIFSFDLKNDDTGRALEMANAISVEFEPAGTRLSFQLDTILLGD